MSEYRVCEERAVYVCEVGVCVSVCIVGGMYKKRARRQLSERSRLATAACVGVCCGCHYLTLLKKSDSLLKENTLII